MVRQSTSPSPTNVVLGGYDGSLAGLSLAADDTTALTLTLNFAYAPHANAVRCAALRSSLLASGGVDETIRIYDLAKAVEVGTLLHHDGTINALQFVRDSHRNLLFSCSDDASICVWRCSDWTCMKQLRAHHAPVVDMAVHQSARVALSIAKDRALCMWNLSKGKVAFSCKTKGTKAPSSVHWSPKGDEYSLTSGTQVTLFSVEGRPNSVLKHQYSVLCEQFIDNHTLATGGEEKTVRIWDTRQATTSVAAFDHDKRVRSLAFVDDLLLSADSNGGIKIWDVRMRGRPRIDTCIADGHLRLTCMTAAHKRDPPATPKIPEDENEVQVSDDESPLSPEADKKATTQSQKPKLPEGTASQRKRKKRKLMKATQK